MVEEKKEERRKKKEERRKKNRLSRMAEEEDCSRCDRCDDGRTAAWQRGPSPSRQRSSHLQLQYR